MIACSWLSLHVVKMSSRDVGISAFLSGCTETFRMPLHFLNGRIWRLVARVKNQPDEGYQELVLMHPNKVTDGNICISISVWP
jgi:hypothetical protein